MTIREVIVILNNHKMLDCQCNFKLTGKPRITVEQLASNLDQLSARVNEISAKLDALIIEVRNGFKAINDRIDNLVKKNNLIE